METVYIKMDEKIQYMIASFLSLVGFLKWRGPLINFSCTDSEPQYQEKILNLTWALDGDWRVVNLKTRFGDDKKTFEEFVNLLRVANRGNANELWGLLGNFTMAGTRPGFITRSGIAEMKVKARNFEEGVEELFKLSTQKVELDLDEKGKIFIPILLVNLEWHHDSYISGLRGFIFSEEEKSFVRIDNPKDTPNYVKKFIDFEKNMLRETAG